MKRNLLYHITPMGCWRENITQLNRYIHIFNGYKIAVVAQGDGLENLADITDELACFDSIRPVENDLELRETPSLALMLTELRKIAPKGHTFFAHTKGVTHHGNPSVELWTRTMYERNLGDLGLVQKLFKSYPVLGCFKRYGTFDALPAGCDWHYSGTFFWFDNATLFARDWKGAIKRHKYGAEAFPGLLYSIDEGGCLFADDVLGRPGDRQRSPHNFDFMRGVCMAIG